MPLIVNNNIELDIERGQVPLTFSVADMKSPEKRRSSTSKTITLIGTSRVMRFLQVIYNLAATDIANSNLQFTFDPRTRIEAQYIEDGVVLFDGLMQVTKAIKSNGSYKFEAVLFSNVLNIVKELEATTIDSLGWSEYDHDLGPQVIRDSWSDSVIVNGVATSNFTGGVPDGFGYIYSWFDMGFPYRLQIGDPRQQRTNEMIVGVYWREILQKCMEYVGVDYNFTLNDTELFKRMVLFNEGGEIVQLSQAEVELREVEKDDEVNILESFASPTSAQIGVRFYEVSRVSFLSNFFDSLITPVTNINTVVNGQIVVNVTGHYRFKFIGDFLTSAVVNAVSEFLVAPPKDRRIVLGLLKNGSIIDQVGEMFFPEQVATTKQNEVYNISYQNDLFLQQGDVLDVVLVYQDVVYIQSGFLTQSGLDLYIESNPNQVSQLISIEAPLEDGDLVEISRHLPNQSAAEWYKGFMRLFNLYQVQQGDEILLIPAQDFYSATNDYEDWTEKLDHSEDIEIEPPNRIQGKFYNAKWSDEDDHYNRIYRQEFAEGYGNNIFDIGNTWQIGTVDIEVPFAQSVPVLVENTQHLFMPAIYRINEDNEAEPIKGNKPRLFFYNGLVQIPQAEQCAVHPSDDSVPWNPLFITQGSDYFFPCFHHTLNPLAPQFDLNFDTLKRKYDGLTTITNDNLWNRYWRTFIQEITSADAKILTAYFKLSKKDIRSLNFDKLKNINGVLYRLNIVKDYIAENNVTTQCELIKVIRAESPSTFVINLAPSIVPPNQNIINAVGGSISSSFTVYLAQNGFTVEPNMVTFLINQLVNSGTFNDYKLIMFPAAWKVGELFAQVPLATNFEVRRASIATRVNSQGLIEVMANDVPRFDYPNGAIVPTLLVEPSATNLALRSEEFGNAYWQKFNASVTANNAVAPDGTMTADKLVEDASNSAHIVRQNINTSVQSTLTVFAKAAERNHISFLVAGAGGRRAGASFNLSNGTVRLTYTNSSYVVNSATIKLVKNNIYRCQLTFNPIGATTAFIEIGVDDGISDFTTSGIQYQGDGTSGVFIWGAQIEQGTEVTSYIPTTTAAVTRAADVMTVNPPSGVTEIFEEAEGGAINVETTIPSTYTIPFGRWRSIKMK